MSLPQLPDLPDLDYNEPKPPKKEVRTGKKKASKKKASKPVDNKTQSTRKRAKSTKKESVNKNKRPRIPKTEYDDDGKPILMVPDLNDVQLNDEINRFFGQKEER